MSLNTQNILHCKISCFFLPLDENDTIFIASNEQCLNINDMPSVCPVVVLPQRRKRRRVQSINIKREPGHFPNTVQETPQMNNDFNEYQNSSPESFSSSGSPTQELGWTNGFLPSLEDFFPFEKIKCIDDFPSIDDVNNVFGIDTNQSYGLFTPTMSSFNFFA